ncbi:MAG TPA: hypothetical protein PL059_12765 [Spirochaetota bacterium]|nr:hypothetical protein [Spirochaetota bacterium]HOM11094.1 hypothetical protein [Spirochaetota bacterium]HPP51103.1 hypothetical protein [Spirochaetota bacterium]
MKFDDSKIYFYFSIAVLVAGILFGLPGIYSKMVTEPAIEKLLAQNTDSQKLKQAYIMLRNPHIFAGYDRYDEAGAGIEYILKEFDNRVAQQKEFTSNDAMYLELLLVRRQQGSDLSIKTMIYFILLSLLGVTALAIEKHVNKK